MSEMITCIRQKKTMVRFNFMSAVYLLSLLLSHYISLNYASMSMLNSSTLFDEVLISNRIHGGDSLLKRGDYSYVARLQITFIGGTTDMCSGVVLTHKTVLTLAQCVSRLGGENALQVIVTLPWGGTYLFTKNEILLHEKYEGLYGANVALLRKNTALHPFMRVSDTPLLPSKSSASEIYNNMDAVIAGWGRTGNEMSITFYPSKLQIANVKIMNENDKLCNDYYYEVISTMIDKEKILCTESNHVLYDGDWGGPLLVKIDNQMKVAGLNLIRLTDNYKNNENKLSAYYKLQPVVGWIEDNLYI